MYNSIPSERLTKLIDYKIKRYNELSAGNPDSPALKYIDGEIKLLQDTILPIVLENTAVAYREIQKFVTTALKKLEKHPLASRTNDVLIHLHLKDSGKEPSVAALFSNMSMKDTIVVDISINQRPESIVPVYYSAPTIYRINPQEEKIDTDGLPVADFPLNKETVENIISRKPLKTTL